MKHENLDRSLTGHITGCFLCIYFVCSAISNKSLLLCGEKGLDCSKLFFLVGLWETVCSNGHDVAGLVQSAPWACFPWKMPFEWQVCPVGSALVCFRKVGETEVSLFLRFWSLMKQLHNSPPGQSSSGRPENCAPENCLWARCVRPQISRLLVRPHGRLTPLECHLTRAACFSPKDKMCPFFKL